MTKRSIWIKGLAIRTMTNKQLSQYEFNVRFANPDELTDHELLLILVKKVDAIETKLEQYDRLFKEHGWIK